MKFFHRIRFYLIVGACWGTMWIIHYLITDSETFIARAVNETWRVIYIIGANFVFYEYVWPAVLRKRKLLIYNILLGIASIWVTMIFLSYGMYAWRQLGIVTGIYTSFLTGESVRHALVAQAQSGFSTLIVFGLAKHLWEYRKLRQATQLLMIEKQKAELNYLKSQTNPHFLFNTLNNIYSLARDKSDLAPEAIMKLSKILRFTLYETGGDHITIEQELQVIRDYLALEKLRYDETLDVNFSYKVDDIKQQLPPLLLIPLVENAFKHGVSETRDKPFVNIDLLLRGGRLEFVVTNSTGDYAIETEIKENIGLSNLRRQLELLYKDAVLNIQRDAGRFTASLTINLFSHV